MLTIAYLANLFPCAVEPYVIDEIEELRRRGIQVVAGSVRKPAAATGSAAECSPEIVLQPLDVIVLWRAAWLCVARWSRISPLIGRVLWRGSEKPMQRLKALLHTWLGAGYAILLHKHGVEHIHVHHGYFGSWIAMVAARLLRLPFSMTLHGSDLLLHGVYLDVKLEQCEFCLTVSNYNRRHILELYPEIDADKVLVSRLGVDVVQKNLVQRDLVQHSLVQQSLAEQRAGQRDFAAASDRQSSFTLLAVGRLHATKNHAFLVKACAELQASGVDFECSIAGEGPERRHLESLIRRHSLENRVTLLGQVARQQMDSLYDRANLVVLTSRSEGIPLVLMEAMARGKVVLAPWITGIPELVAHGTTGFLYEPESLDDFLSQLLFVRSLLQACARNRLARIPSAARQLDWIRHAARVRVCHDFNRSKNLKSFSHLFLSRLAPRGESLPHEDFVLQQI